MKSFGPDGPGPVPQLLLRASAVVLVASAVLLVAGAFRIGVTWDESYHVQRYDNYVETGWYVIDAQLDENEPLEHIRDQYVYGPATMSYLHAINRVFGQDPPGSAGITANAYVARHLGVALLGVLGLVGVAVLGRMVLRRWDWGVVAAALLSSVPMWTGHAMFNLKDVPVGTGYVWLTVGLCLLARDRPGSMRLRAASVVSIAGGSWLMIGTRPGMWTAATASITALLVATALRERQARAGHGAMRWRLGEMLAGLLLAFGGLAILYPKVFLHPLHTAYESATSSANFLGIASSRAFVPVHVLLQMPLFVQLLLAVGVVAALQRMVRVIRAVDVVQVRLTLIGVQMLTLPLITVVHPSALYGDLRQLLFSAPAAAVFATVGVATIAERVRAGVDQVPMAVVAVVGVVAMLLPLANMTATFPYSYAYYNVLGRVVEDSDHPEYYRGSGRELLPSLPPEGRVVCTPVRDADKRALRVSHLDGAQDCRTAVASPIAAFAAEAEGSLAPLGEDEFWAITFGGDPPNCDEEERVTRLTAVGRVVMSSLNRCAMPFPVLGDRLVEFGNNSNTGNWAFFDEGWNSPGFSPGRVGFRARPEGGSIGFRLPQSDRPLPVEVGAARRFDPAQVKILVDGVDTPYTGWSGDRFVVRFLVPPTGGTHRVEFRPRVAGADPGVYLVSIALGRTS